MAHEIILLLAGPMETRSFDFGKDRIEITPATVVCSTEAPNWLRRFFVHAAPEQIREFFEDGRLVNRVELYELDGAIVKVRGSGVAHLEVLVSHRERPRGRIARLFHDFALRLTARMVSGATGIVRLRGNNEIERAREAAAVINALASEYRSRFRKNLRELFYIYDTDTRYTWEIKPSLSHGVLRTVLYILSLCVLWPTVVYGVLVLLELISAGFAYWVSVILAGYAVGLVFTPQTAWANWMHSTADTTVRLQDPDEHVDPIDRRAMKIALQVSYATMFTALTIASFAIVGFMMGSPLYWFADGFAPLPVPRLTWSLFLLESLLDTLTLDTFGALGLDFAHLSTASRQGSISVVILKFLMASGVVAAIFRAIKTGQRTHSFVGTPRELLTEVLMSTNFLSIGEVMLNGKVVTLPRAYVFDARTPENPEQELVVP